ncbi:MAG: hypothetical protein RL329_3144 [Bacteroidota bacterium]|jgi:predicted ATP-dependent endonuclease of OLD family
MYIKTIQIIHFKSFKNVTIHLNSGLNLFTGINNSGKTTVLEAIALWHECFHKLLVQARTNRSSKNASAYRKGDYILGSPQMRYFDFEQINSIRFPKFESIFYELAQEIPIRLIVKLEKIHAKNNKIENLEIGFQIKNTNTTYEITLIDFQNYPFEAFNQFFDTFPTPIQAYFAANVASLPQIERFTTPPNITNAILQRYSTSVLRNRLYLLYHKVNDKIDSNPLPLFSRFLADLNYILFDKEAQMLLTTQSHIQRDTQVVFEVKMSARDMIEKDIALLGSGTLQIIEILLNVYDRKEDSNLNLVLLDEPDSYIHRNIQTRLLSVLEAHTQQSQIFITTHNEAMIRAAATNHLFHIEAKAENTYHPIDNQQLIKLVKTGDKRFKGIYPTATNSVIRTLGSSTGLDFINAIESDRILFVEGEDDAQVIYLLLQKAIIPKNSKKYVFWVLNGIANVFKEINMYKTLFPQIKNEKSLWDKSVLIMDRDFLSDEHTAKIAQKMKEKLGLPTYIMDVYTFETSLLTDFKKLSRLLAKWIDNKYEQKIDAYILENKLELAYNAYKNEVETKYLKNPIWIEGTVQRYITVRNQTNDLFGKGHQVIEQSDAKLVLYYQKYLEDCIQNQLFYKLMNKKEVQWIINSALLDFQFEFDIEKDFILLLMGVDRATWFSAWDFLIDLAKG